MLKKIIGTGLVLQLLIGLMVSVQAQSTPTNRLFIGVGYTYTTPHLEWISTNARLISLLEMVSWPAVKLGYQHSNKWRISVGWHLYDQYANYEPPPTPDFQTYKKNVLGSRGASYLDVLYSRNITSWLTSSVDSNSRFSIWGSLGIRNYGIIPGYLGIDSEIGNIERRGWHTFVITEKWYDNKKNAVIILRPSAQVQAKYRLYNWLSLDGSISWAYTRQRINPFVFNLDLEFSISTK